MKIFTTDITHYRFSLPDLFLLRGGFRLGSVTLITGLLNSLNLRRPKHEKMSQMKNHVTGKLEITVGVERCAGPWKFGLSWSTCILHKVPFTLTLYDRAISY